MAKVDALQMAKAQIKSFSDLIPSSTEDVIKVPLSELHEFKNHPFKVLMDEKMNELVESVKANGVLVPIIVRKRTKGGYEIIAGHRRTTAARLAELTEIDAICKKFTDDEATIIMVDSNIQREELLVSERAFAYKMKLDAMKHQGKKTALPEGKTSRDLVAEESGENARTVAKYIRLTNLIDGLLTLADLHRLKFNPAYELSFLPADAQEIVLSVIESCEKCPDVAQAAEIRALPVNRSFTKAVTEILSGKKKPSRSYKYANQRFNEVFTEDMSQEEVDSQIDFMLGLYAAYQEGKIDLGGED